jgi:hypothetical protein
MVLLPTPHRWARPYWEKPRSSLSSRSLSGFLEAVLIFIFSPHPKEQKESTLFLYSWRCVRHSLAPCGLSTDKLYGRAIS